MSYDEDLATRIRALLADRDDVVEKKMFGGLCFMVNGAMCCGLTKSDFMVRVGGDAFEAALAEPHARPMDFTGRAARVAVHSAGARDAGSVVFRGRPPVVGDDAAMTAPPCKPEETLRLHQANERTMLAWIRTGIALMAFGFAIARFGLFLRQLAAAGSVAVASHDRVGSGWLGAVLVALGMIANLVATLRYASVRKAIERGDVGAPDARLVYVLGGTATLVGLAMTVLLLRSLAE